MMGRRVANQKLLKLGSRLVSYLKVKVGPRIYKFKI